jgi:hypothetical protein
MRLSVRSSMKGSAPGCSGASVVSTMGERSIGAP